MPVSKGDFNVVLKGVESAVKKLPRQAAAGAESFFRENFKLQGWRGNAGLQPWPAHGPRTLRKHRLLLGIGTGNLYKGIKKFVTGASIGVQVTGVAATYADIHNFGGTVTITVTPKLRSWAWAMYYKLSGRQYRAAGAKYGGRSAYNAAASASINFYKNLALTRKKQLVITIPRRQFIGESNMLNAQLQQMFEQALLQAVKGH